jgi:hypothetical protein
MHNRNRVGDGSWGSILEVGDRFFSLVGHRFRKSPTSIPDSVPIMHTNNGHKRQKRQPLPR